MKLLNALRSTRGRRSLKGQPRRFDANGEFFRATIEQS
jgi:hypothetical protein